MNKGSKVISINRGNKAVDGGNLSGTQGSSRPKTLAEILKKNEAVSLFLYKRKKKETTEIISLVDRVSEKDQEALQKMACLIVDLADDLIKRITRLQNENTELRSIALVDGLTGLYNNRFFSMQLNIETARTRRTGLPCSLLMIDLDGFKLLNDTLGHLEGNKFLIKVSQVLREHLRPTDMLCRYGGDEFTVIMPATGLSSAIQIANRLKKAVSDIPIKKDIHISTSIGVSEYTPASHYTTDDFIHASDTAMYDAKKAGKNQVSVDGNTYETEPQTEPVTAEEKEALWKGLGAVQHQGDNNEA